MGAGNVAAVPGPPLSSASRRRRPASSTSARRTRRWRTGWWPGGGAGRFLLRIEDTDAERNRPELSTTCWRCSEWLGLDWDGEPRPPERPHRRRTARRRRDAGANGPRLLVRLHRRAGAGPGQGAGRPAGLRRPLPRPGLEPAATAPRCASGCPTGRTGWTDLVRGEVDVRQRHASRTSCCCARTARRCSCSPTRSTTSHMGITHVIRGEDHVNSTPKYLLILRGARLPEPDAFAHMPLLVNERAQEAVEAARRRVGGRLPRRGLPARGDGQLPGPARVGAARRRRGPSDRARSWTCTTCRHVNPSPAFFDRKKLLHVNGEWIRPPRPSTTSSPGPTRSCPNDEAARRRCGPSGRWCRSGCKAAVGGRPTTSTSCGSTSPSIDDAAVGQGDGAGQGLARDARRVDRRARPLADGGAAPGTPTRSRRDRARPQSPPAW